MQNPRANQPSRISSKQGATLCRYFIHGACTAGALCHFSHDVKDKQSMVCKYYLKGACSYGKGCRYDHIKPTGTNYQNKSAPSVSANINRMDNSPLEFKMVSLKTSSKISVDRTSASSNWVDAPVFIPGQAYKGSSEMWNAKPSTSSEGACCPPLTYSQAALTNVDIAAHDGLTVEEASEIFCPYAAIDQCFNKSECPYLHGLECDMCGEPCLHPRDEEQQKEHRRGCLENHEKDMEHSFAIQRSENVTCAVCLDVVKNKSVPSERRFGILPNCSHAFCLACIRKWRKESNAEKKVVRACPICRTPSGYVIPSSMWVEDADEKSKLITEYKTALGVKPCKYFKEGKGTCPFASSCFYKHAYPDGSIAVEKPRKFNTADGIKIAQNFSLWDFVEAEENNRLDSDSDDELYLEPDDILERLENMMIWDDSDEELFFLF